MIGELLLAAAVGLGNPLTAGPRGFGAAATGGGSCPTIAVVSTTALTGVGSITEALGSGVSDRCVHFSVPGRIKVTPGTRFDVQGNNLTIDCRTAPRPGIYFEGLVTIGFDGGSPTNHIWRHCRFVRGGEAPGSPLVIQNLETAWFDHMTSIYGADQGASIFPVRLGERAHNISFTDPLWADQLGCDAGLIGRGLNASFPDGCHQTGHSVPGNPHNYNSLFGGNVKNISIWRAFFGFGRVRNPSIGVGPPDGTGPVPASDLGLIEKIQSWHHYTKLSNSWSCGSWSMLYDAIGNVYTANRDALPEDMGSSLTGCTASVLRPNFWFPKLNVEGTTLATLSSPTGPQNAIFSWGGLALTGAHTAPARQVTTHALPYQGPPLETVAAVAASAGALLPCRGPLETRAIKDALAGATREIDLDEREFGGWPDLAATESCSGFKNRPVDAVNVSGTGATNTQIDWDASCTDPDGKPFARYYRIVTQPSQGVVTIDGETGDGNFSATGVAAAAYGFQYSCHDGDSTDTATSTVTVTP